MSDAICLPPVLCLNLSLQEGRNGALSFFGNT